jgi:hypothetical protein
MYDVPTSRWSSPALSLRKYSHERFPYFWIGHDGPRLPDLDPVDYYLWGHVVSLVHETKAAQDLPQPTYCSGRAHTHHHETIAAPVRSLLMHAGKCIDSQGGNFEQLL